MAIVTLVDSKATPNEGIKYITNPQKAALVESRNLDSTEDFSKQMRRTARLWRKAQGHDDRKYYHLKISFAKEDWVQNGGTLTEEKAMLIANKILVEFFNSRESVTAVHSDTDVLHVHGIINSVDLIDGKMLDMRDSEYRKLKDRVQELCRENGLKAIDWRKAVKEKREKESQNDAPVKETFAEKGLKERGQTSWKDTLRTAIDNALESCCTMEEFKEKLSEQGIVLTRCTENTISYKLGEHKACRGDTLGGDYTAAAIRDALDQNRAFLVSSMQSKEGISELEQLIGAAKDNENDATPEERTVFREWGRTVGFRRSEIDALYKYRNPACSWEEKQQVWDIYKRGKDDFFSEYNERSQAIQNAISDAYKRRKRVKTAEWAIDPRNRYKTFFGVIFAAVVFARNDSLPVIEREIKELKQKQDELRRSISAFKNATETTRETLKMKGLPLETYMDSVKKVQNLAEELHNKGRIEIKENISEKQREHKSKDGPTDPDDR